MILGIKELRVAMHYKVILGGGGGVLFFQEHLLLAHADFSSCLLNLETHFGKVWRQSVAMVMEYDTISSMISSHF